MDSNGWIDVLDWRIPFQLGQAVQVALELADMPLNTPVWLKLGNQPPLPLLGGEADTRYTITLTLPPAADGVPATLLIGCDHLSPDTAGRALEVGMTSNQACWEFTGSLQRVNPVTVADRLTGEPLAQAQVALWQYRRTTHGPQALLWPASVFGQENPVLTTNEGYFNFVLPRAFYGITVRKAGYQPFRYGAFPFTGPLPPATIGLTPLPPAGKAALPTAVVALNEAGFDQPVLEIAPGTAVRFTNLSGDWVQVQDAPQSASKVNSGLLTPGDSYQFLFATAGQYVLTNGEDSSQTLLVVVQEPTAVGWHLFLSLVTR